MKQIKPLINQKCQFEGCEELATCRLFGKNYCRTHYLEVLHNWRFKNQEKEKSNFIKCAKCDRKIEKSFANLYLNNYYCLSCVQEIGGLR